MDAAFCKVCSCINQEDDISHEFTKGHRFNWLLKQWNDYRKALVKNRHGIEVKIQPNRVNGHVYNYSEDAKKGKHILRMSPHTFYLHNNYVEFLCTAKNVQKSNSVILTSAQLLHPYELYRLYDPQGNFGPYESKYPKLQGGANYSVIVRFSCRNFAPGSYKIPVAFTFQTTNENPDEFTIARAIIVSIEEQTYEPEASMKSPFTNSDWVPQVTVKPTKHQSFSTRFTIPKDRYLSFKFGLKEVALMSNELYNQMADIRAEMEPGFVTLNNYCRYWHNVLWLEEVGQALMLKRYNMENVQMKIIQGERLELEVPGLAEKRPSVIVGDMIEIRVHNDHKAYMGVIKNVNDKTVEIAYVNEELLSFISIYPGIELDVRFVLSRLHLERMHMGVQQIRANNNVSLLFPNSELLDRTVHITRTLRDTEFFNQQIVTNYEQKTAVLKILNDASRGAPYIVFGPPGTGKTVTIVEAILQIKKKTTQTILVCAPANAACDMLTAKLMQHCTSKELIRIVSDTVDVKNMNPHILDYTNYNADGNTFMKILPKELARYRIVVTTLILIGRYTGSYHPDVVFVDEAAQACEPEIACAIGMLQKNKQVVLAGDPRQLGPSPSSRAAGTHGLGKSLLERLMDLDLYKALNANFITMLKLNFRSHSTILQLPNELYYNNQLQAVSQKSQHDPLADVCVYEKIMMDNKNGKHKKTVDGQAIEFCSIISKERREGRSPSYFNIKEMHMVLRYVKALTQLEFEDEEDRVLPEHIGVVTPYKRQVYKIQDLLRQHKFDNVEIGTTETFQGREKRVIIISTVRAQQDLLLYDKKYDLGFVKNEKRFNVALTRAMSKLIIIGCAHVLGTARNWAALIELSEELSAFFGAPYARRTQHVMDDITGRLERVEMVDTQYKK